VLRNVSWCVCKNIGSKFWRYLPFKSRKSNISVSQVCSFINSIFIVSRLKRPCKLQYLTHTMTYCGLLWSTNGEKWDPEFQPSHWIDILLGFVTHSSLNLKLTVNFSIISTFLYFKKCFHTTVPRATV